jgi:hypothetical protein
VPGCTGTDYLLGPSGGYILAPFQTTFTCDNPGQILRTLPADAPLGAYQFCTTIDASPAATVCTAYYIINFGTSFR